MFEIKRYKKNALSNLRGRWVSCAIITAICGIIESALSQLYSTVCNFEIITFSDGIFFLIISLLQGITGVFLFAQCAIYFKMDCLPLEKITINDFLSALEKWHKGFLGFLWSTLWLILWFMLFIIPGFVKYFAYSQIYFILAENPKCGIRKALNISKIITLNHKMDLFIMLLSFLPWMILCLVPMVVAINVTYPIFANSLVANILLYSISGAGFFFLVPYILSAHLYAYKELKAEAIARGVIKMEDFNS